MKALAVLTGIILACPQLSAQEFNRIAAYIGGGFTNPVGDTSNRVHTGWNFVTGAGYRMASHFSLGLDYSLMGGDADVVKQVNSGALGGNMLNWGLTVNPTFEVGTKGRFGGYITGGYGLYYRRLQLTTPTVVAGTYCDPWWGFCYTAPVAADLILAERSTVRGGFNVGGGITFGAPRAKLFVEVRYHHMFTRDIATEMLPVTFGVRF